MYRGRQPGVDKGRVENKIELKINMSECRTSGMSKQEICNRRTQSGHVGVAGCKQPHVDGDLGPRAVDRKRLVPSVGSL